MRTLNEPRTALRLAGWAILVAGLAAAVFLFVQADRKARELAQAEANGAAYYLEHPEYTKKYVRELELYGGKVNVLADRFTRWLSSLTEGKNLAFVVGIGAALAALGCFALAKPKQNPPPRKETS